MPLKVYVELDGVELTRRELETMLYIHDYTLRDPLRRPPTHEELLKHLNRVLPGDEQLVSTQQTQRVAQSLRDKGLLFDPAKYPKLKLGKDRNMRLAEVGESLVIEWRARQQQK